MKELFKKIKQLYLKDDNAFYLSLIGPLAMGTIHLVFIIIKFDWILFNYSLFFYLMVLFKVWQWAIEKFRLKPNSYIAGIISMLIILAPMMASFVLTILYKDAPHYFVDWFIYAYALFATLKMVFAVKGLLKKNKSAKQYVLSYLGLIAALYTIQMMEFALIMTFSDESDKAMYLMQLFTQGAIFLFSLFVIVLFIYKLVTSKKKVEA